MQQWRQIQALSEERLGGAAIARRLGVDRETVGRWRGQASPGIITRTRTSKLDEYRDHLRQRLEAFPELTARVLFRELQSRGYEGGYERVKVFCREQRGERALELTARFETGPGEQAQLDRLERLARKDQPSVCSDPATRCRFRGFPRVGGMNRAIRRPTLFHRRDSSHVDNLRTQRSRGGHPHGP